MFINVSFVYITSSDFKFFEEHIPKACLGKWKCKLSIKENISTWYIELAAMHACGELMSPRIFTYVPHKWPKHHEQQFCHKTFGQWETHSSSMIPTWGLRHVESYSATFTRSIHTRVYVRNLTVQYSNLYIRNKINSWRFVRRSLTHERMPRSSNALEWRHVEIDEKLFTTLCFEWFPLI